MDVHIPETWEEAARDLLVVLRRVTEPNAHLVASLHDDDGLVRSEGLPFLHNLLVIDRPEYRLYVRHSHLAKWQVTAEHAFQRAWLSIDPVEGLTQRDDGLWQLDSGDGYQVSRLLLPKWLASFRGKVPGMPVAIAPHARLLLVGGADDPEQVELLRVLAEKAFRAAGGQLSPVLYGLEGDAVTPWVPPNDHPQAGPLAANRAWLCAWEYDQQRYLLEDEVLTPLARATLVRRGRGGFTYATWGDDVLLPVTDFVVVSDDSGGNYLVPWPLIEQLADNVLTETELVPRRLQTAPLTDAQRATLCGSGIRIDPPTE